jgi:hypothetical protein
VHKAVLAGFLLDEREHYWAWDPATR